MKKKYLLILIIVAVVVAAIVLKPNQLTRANNELHVTTVSRSAIESSFFTSGTIEYAIQANLSAEIVAKVVNILVAEGELVTKGQTLIALDNNEIATEIEQKEILVERAQVNVKHARRLLKSKHDYFARIKQLVSKKYSHEDQLTKAKDELDLAEISLQGAEVALKDTQISLALTEKQADKTRIVSPINGMVVNIPIKLGETAVASARSIAGSELITIADPESYRVKAVISEFDLARIQLNQAVNLTVRSQPELPLAGTITQVGNSIVSANQQKNIAVTGIPIEISFDKSTLNIISGLNCDIEILQAQREDTLQVPIGAVQETVTRSDKRYVKGKITSHYVYVLNNNIIYKRPVTLGIADNYSQEILVGLNDGDDVITGPAKVFSSLSDGVSLTTLNVKVSRS